MIGRFLAKRLKLNVSQANKGRKFLGFNFTTGKRDQAARAPDACPVQDESTGSDAPERAQIVQGTGAAISRDGALSLACPPLQASGSTPGHGSRN
jgi:hypothetical protein